MIAPARRGDGTDATAPLAGVGSARGAAHVGGTLLRAEQVDRGQQPERDGDVEGRDGGVLQTEGEGDALVRDEVRPQQQGHGGREDGVRGQRQLVAHGLERGDEAEAGDEAHGRGAQAVEPDRRGRQRVRAGHLGEREGPEGHGGDQVHDRRGEQPGADARAVRPVGQDHHRHQDGHAEHADQIAGVHAGQELQCHSDTSLWNAKTTGCGFDDRIIT